MKIQSLGLKGTDYSNEISGLEVSIERDSNKLVDLQNKMNSVNEISDKTGIKISQSFKKGEQSLKRFALSLFSLGSVYAMLSKASSSYYAIDEERSKKLQSIWVGLGAMLTPISDFITDTLLKGLGYLNEFIKALTGIDFIANANARALKNQSNAQKELNNQITPFDEMNRVSDSNIGTTVGGSSGLIEIPELDQRIIEKLKEMAKWLKENWNWLSKVLAVAGIVFGAAKISGWLKNIGMLIGSASSRTGLLGLNSILKTIATIGVVAIGVDLVYKALTGRDLVQDLKDIYNGIKDIKNINKDLIETNKQVSATTRKIVDQKTEESKTWEKGSKEIAQYTAYLDSVITSSATTIKKNMEWADGLSLLDEMLAMVTGDMDKNTQKTNECADTIDKMMTSYKTLYEQGKLTDEQAQRYLTLLEAQKNGTESLSKVIDYERSSYANLAGALDETKSSAEKAEASIGLLGSAILNTTNKNYSVKIDTEFTTPDTSKLTNAISKISGALGTGVAGLVMSNFKLATGGIVNNPGRGVPIGYRAIGGEAGKEGVIPLTDSQAMEELGSTIGKYITINLTNNTNLDGRLIQRHQSKISANKNFATNR